MPVSIHKTPYPQSQQVIWLTIEQLVVILYDSCRHLFPSSQWGGYHFVFYTANNNRKCRWVLFPFWHQYCFRTMLLRSSSSAAGLALSLPGATEDECRIPQQRYTAEEPSPRSLLVSRPLLPCVPGQLPIPFWDTMTLSFDSWGCFLLSLNFFSPPLSFSFTPLFSFPLSIFEGL